MNDFQINVRNFSKFEAVKINIQMKSQTFWWSMSFSPITMKLQLLLLVFFLFLSILAQVKRSLVLSVTSTGHWKFKYISAPSLGSFKAPCVLMINELSFCLFVSACSVQFLFLLTGKWTETVAVRSLSAILLHLRSEKGFSGVCSKSGFASW